MNYLNPTFQAQPEKDKVIVVLGATGTGKSRLSIDLATKYFPSEVINSDKMQVYRGLDITTNKISLQERLAVPHHVFDEFDSEDGELTPCSYRKIASAVIESITSRNKIPMVVGGSNSFIHSLLSEHFIPSSDIFSDPNSFISPELRYNCCFLWIDVKAEVLYQYIRRRVDDMFDSGMLEELRDFYESKGEAKLEEIVGIKKAIGYPEYKEYYIPAKEFTTDAQYLKDQLAEFVKMNTWNLVNNQLYKIRRLRDAGWEIRRLDASDAFSAMLEADSVKFSEMWQKNVLEPSVETVKMFLVEPTSGNSD